jgi:hypothetical protein
MGSEGGREVPADVGAASELHTSAIVGRVPDSCAQHREIRFHVSSVGSRLHPLRGDGREGRSPCIMRMSVRPSVKPSKRTRPAYSCHHARHVCRRWWWSTHVIANAAERVDVIAWPAHVVVQPLWGRPPKIKAISGSSKPSSCGRIVQSHQTKVRKARAACAVHQNVQL